MSGLDIGTSFITLATEKNNSSIEYKDFRDAFYVIKPSTQFAIKMVEKGLEGKIYVKDEDGSFIILGMDAIEKAIERHDSAKRPMYRGVVSAKERASRKILSFLLKEIVGQAKEQDTKLVYCVPAQPINHDDEEFDVGYHKDVVNRILLDLGYQPKAIFEAEALCYAELEKENFTGIGISSGAGMNNICVMSSGEPVLVFSLTNSGDWIDRMSSVATGEPDTVIQAEKENGEFVIGEPNDSEVLSAVSAYYERLIDYVAKHLTSHMKASKALPKFKEDIAIVVAGGTSKAKGYIEMLEKKLAENDFPLKIKEVRPATDPQHAVAKGCLIASKIM